MKMFKKFLAIIAIIIILGSIFAICALLFNSGKYSDTVFRGLISCLIAIPLVAYGYMLLLRYAKNISANLKNVDEENDN